MAEEDPQDFAHFHKLPLEKKQLSEQPIVVDDVLEGVKADPQIKIDIKSAHSSEQISEGQIEAFLAGLKKHLVD